MTKTLFVCALAAVGLTACEQQQTSTELVQAPEAPSLTPAEDKPLSEPPIVPPPAPVKTVEAAPPPAKPTIGSTVWATGRISVTTDEGIIGIPAGAKLRVVRENETGYVVTDEKQEFPVTTAQVSLDSRSASNAAMAEAAARSAQAAWQQKQSATTRERNKTALESQTLAEIQNRHDRLAREEAALQASLKRAQAEDLEAYQSAQQRRYYARSITPQQVSAWTSRLFTVQAEKTKAYWELKQAQK
jgi:hypothetical protein